MARTTPGAQTAWSSSVSVGRDSPLPLPGLDAGAELTTGPCVKRNWILGGSQRKHPARGMRSTTSGEGSSRSTCSLRKPIGWSLVHLTELHGAGGSREQAVWFSEEEHTPRQRYL